MSKRSASLVSTRRNRISSLGARSTTVCRRSAAMRWISIRAPRPAESILRVAAERLEHTPDEEVRVALEEIAKIARLRLEETL